MKRGPAAAVLGVSVPPCMTACEQSTRGRDPSLPLQPPRARPPPPRSAVPRGWARTNAAPSFCTGSRLPRRAFGRERRRSPPPCRKSPGELHTGSGAEGMVPPTRRSEARGDDPAGLFSSPQTRTPPGTIRIPLAPEERVHAGGLCAVVAANSFARNRSPQSTWPPPPDTQDSGHRTQHFSLQACIPHRFTIAFRLPRATEGPTLPRAADAPPGGPG
jgi:hypothetical protein